jgi:predicted RNA-binding protein with PUA domain
MIEKLLEQLVGLTDTATTSKKLHTLAKTAADLTESFTKGEVSAAEYTELMGNINVSKVIVTESKDIKTKQDLMEVISKAIKLVSIMGRIIPRP